MHPPRPIPEAQAEALVARACAARPHAYAPYSNFQVGAALLTAGGEIFAGVNVENCALGSTICAERHAVGAAIAAGAKELVAVAVVADAKELLTPCGACRQVLAELAVAWVVMHNLRDRRTHVEALATLLPAAPALGDLARGGG